MNQYRNKQYNSKQSGFNKNPDIKFLNIKAFMKVLTIEEFNALKLIKDDIFHDHSKWFIYEEKKIGVIRSNLLDEIDPKRVNHRKEDKSLDKIIEQKIIEILAQKGIF